MTNAYTRALGTPTPQTEPLSPDQVRNNAGGYVYGLDVWARLNRFLILGTDGGTYYVNERRHTLDNVAVVDQALATDPARTVARAAEVSDLGLAPSNDEALLVLAKAIADGGPDIRRAAGEALGSAARIGTHVYTWLDFYRALNGGWGRSTRRAVADVYNGWPVDRAALQAIKYRQRGGWSHRDALRLAHPRTDDPARNAVYKFMTTGEVDDDAPPLIHAYRAANDPAATVPTIVRLIADQRLPWEAIPSDKVNAPEVLVALLERMPVGATVRQIARYARAGMLSPLSEVEKIIIDRVTDPELIRKARLHPLAFLEASYAHASGGTSGRSRGPGYTPNANIVAALETGFAEAFHAIEPAGKRTYLALDVSASMGWGTIGRSAVLTPYVASAAMALVTAHTEPRTHIAAFSQGMVPIDAGPRDSVQSIVRKAKSLPHGGTDCARPMLDALDRGIEADVFVVYTDNESWAGPVHVREALRRYRTETGIPARLVAVGMTATEYSVNDPGDPLGMDVVGFSADAPAMISRFASGALDGNPAPDPVGVG